VLIFGFNKHRLTVALGSKDSTNFLFHIIKIKIMKKVALLSLLAIALVAFGCAQTPETTEGEEMMMEGEEMMMEEGEMMEGEMMEGEAMEGEVMEGEAMEGEAMEETAQ